LGVELVGEGDGHGEAALWAVDFELFAIKGDAEEEGEEDLLKHHKNELKCDVFSAGHHGSKTSNSQELLEAAMPSYVVISCGADNKYGHPHQEALDVFQSINATVYRTDLLGSIVFVTDGENLEKK
jgi:beta-lactamase superfamily II metal-dependent hydrolase